MKRISLLSIVFLLLFGNLSAQNNENSESDRELARWSIYLKGGVSVPKSSEGFWPWERKFFDPSFGLGVERTFTSLWGMGLDYTYMPIENDVYKANIHFIDITTPVNISNLLAPCREHAKKLNIFFRPGIGFGIGGHNEFTDLSGAKVEKVSGQESFNMLFGIAAEYDISNHFAIGANVEYRWISNQWSAPFIDIKYGDMVGFYTANLSVRYKFAGKDNIRNNNQLVAMCRPVSVDDGRIAQLEKAVKDLQDKIVQDSLRNTIDEENLAKLKDAVDQLIECCEAKATPVDFKISEPTVIPTPVKITLHNIYYTLGKWDLLPESYPELDKVVEFMQKNPDFEVEIGSHTDSRGSDALNLDLSNKRAQAVVDYLVNKGIEQDRVTAKGYGETELLNRCKNGVKCSEAEHAVNRRTEFIILNANSSTIISSELIDNPSNYTPETLSAAVAKYATTNAPAYVVVGSFLKQQNAVIAADMLSKAGEKAEILDTNGPFRVGIPCESEEAADAKLIQIKAVRPDAWIAK